MQINDDSNNNKKRGRPGQSGRRTRHIRSSGTPAAAVRDRPIFIIMYTYTINTSYNITTTRIIRLHHSDGVGIQSIDNMRMLCVVKLL